MLPNLLSDLVITRTPLLESFVMKSLWKNFAALLLALSTGVSLESHGFGQAIGSPAPSGGGTGGGSKGPGAAVPGAAASGVSGSDRSTIPGPGSPTATGGGAGGGLPGARPSASGTGDPVTPGAAGVGSGSGVPAGQNPQSPGLDIGRTRLAPTPGTNLTTGQTGSVPGQSGTTTTGGTAAGGARTSSGLSTTPGRLFRAKQIVGSKVQLSGNVSAGTVDDFVVDESGYVEYVIVNNNGQYVTVPWDATAFNFEKQTAVINIPQEQFQRIPTYTADKYPVFSEPQYRTTIYRSYGLTPRDRPGILIRNPLP